MRLALLLEYDGTRFAGSQLQPGRPTVQGELENAIAGLLGRKVRASFAGRTDAGVHAAGQVASFPFGAQYTVDVVRRALNARLPDDIAVLEAREAPDDLDVRRHAVGRSYRYRILLARERSPLRRGQTWRVAGEVDLEALSTAASLLQGRRDFASFAAAPSGGSASTVRELRTARVRRFGREVWLDFEGNAFLPHQVRLMVGAMIKVGRGQASLGDLEELLRRPETGKAGPMAPPQGLCLLRVTYEGWEFDAHAKTATVDLQPEGWRYQA